MISHTCMCGAEILLNSTQSNDQLRCPDCGMALILGKSNAPSTAKDSGEGYVPADQAELFPDAETAALDRSELLALSKSTSKVCSGIRAFRVSVLLLIVCAFLFSLGTIFDAYRVNPTITNIVALISFGVAIITAFYALGGWYFWSKVVPPGLTVRRSLLKPLLATSKFGFWILFLVPVAAGFLSAETWLRKTDATTASNVGEESAESDKLNPLKLEKHVDEIVDVSGNFRGGILGKVGMGFLLPAIILPTLLTLSIFQIRKFLASWRNEPFSTAVMIAAAGLTFLFTLVALVPILGFLISVVAGLYWNRQLTSIGNKSLMLLTKLSKAAQEQPDYTYEESLQPT